MAAARVSQRASTQGPGSPCKPWSPRCPASGRPVSFSDGELDLEERSGLRGRCEAVGIPDRRQPFLMDWQAGVETKAVPLDRGTGPPGG